MRLHLKEGRLAVCRLPPGAPVAEDVAAATFFSLTRTEEELSLVCDESAAPREARSEQGWRRMEVEGPLDLQLTGVLASLAAPLAAAGIPIFCMSTFDTDHLLVREEHLERAITVLTREGHRVQR